MFRKLRERFMYAESYKTRDAETRNSAAIIISRLLAGMAITSVVDVGCGVGTWLSVFHEKGVKNIAGIEGAWLDKRYLAIPERHILVRDLGHPFRLDRTFDLAVTLEVAEHLPVDRAQDFVKTVTSLAPTVLFSAAVPGQGGVGHRNEQWQSYWAKLFYSCGYLPVDFIRNEIWGNNGVAWWYAQNILLYVRRDRLDLCSFRDHLYEAEQFSSLDLVHPRNYSNALRRSTWQFMIRRLIKNLLHFNK